MLRALFLLLCVLSVFPAAASPSSGVKKPNSAQTASPEALRISADDRTGVIRWVLQRMTFTEEGYSEGDKASVIVSITVGRNGRMKELELKSATNEDFAKKVLAAISEVDKWTPRQENGRAVGSTQEFGMDLLLVRGADGALHAVDNTIYMNVDTELMFKGQSVRYFRSWVKGQVDSLLGVDVVRNRLNVNFIIEKDGSVSNVEILKAPNIEIARAIKQVIEGAPYWTPIQLDGEAVRYNVLLTIGFTPVTDGSKNDVVEMPDVMPRFMGGTLELFKRWVRANVEYPREMLQNGIQGRVVVSVVVGGDGLLTDVVVLETPHSSLSLAVCRVLARAPKWIPGMLDGQPVSIKYTVPVIFQMQTEVPQPIVAPLGSPFGN